MADACQRRRGTKCNSQAAALQPELLKAQHGHNYIKFILPFLSNTFVGTPVKGRAPNQGIRGAVPKKLHSSLATQKLSSVFTQDWRAGSLINRVLRLKNIHNVNYSTVSINKQFKYIRYT